MATLDSISDIYNLNERKKNANAAAAAPSVDRDGVLNAGEGSETINGMAEQTALHADFDEESCRPAANDAMRNDDD